MNADESNLRQEFLELLRTGSERAVADMAVGSIGTDRQRFEIVTDMCFEEPYPVCMRAARVIQLCCEHHPQMILPRLPEIIDKVMDAGIDGVKRNFLKIFADFIPLEQLGDPGRLLNYCFDILLNLSEKPGTRIQCMKIIHKIADKEPELRREFREALEFCLEDAKPSFRNCALKYCIKQ